MPDRSNKDWHLPNSKVTFSKLNTVLMLEGMSFIWFKPAAIYVGAVDSREITQIELAVSADKADRGMRFGNSRIRNSDEIRGESTNSGVIVGEIDTLFVDEQISLRHLNI